MDAGATAPAVQPLTRQNVTPGLDGAVKLHPADPNRTLDVTVSLSLGNQPALAAFLQQVSDPRSPRYGRYLSPAQFTASFGPTPDQVQQVTGHLRSQGLAVTSVSSNRALVRATGPVHAVEAAFGVTISDWHDQRLNRDFFGNDTQPSLPASIAPLVVGIFGLENHYRFHHHAIRSSLLAPSVGGGPAGGYTPTEVKTAYDVNPLAAQGINGSGQSLGLFELDGFTQANITTYDTQYSLATSPPTRIVVGAGPSPALGLGEIEVELDIEVMQAFAPGASIAVWEGQNSAQGAVDTYNAMVTSNSTASNSTSWGACEPDTPISLMDTFDQSFRQAAAQGQSFFAASGDFGAYDCRQDTPSSNQVVVDNPASDPYVTGVGATTLLLNANSTYQSESAWSNSATAPPSGSGGGLSTHFAQPAWQTGPGVSNSFSNGMRQVPDVAMDGDPQTGYSIYTTNNATTPPTTGWFMIGGTSAGAPSWAAFTALYNQFAKSFGRGNLGFANPSLYGAGTNAQPSPPYHDIITGDNLVYLATPGWDYPTGWGTPDVTSLVADILVARSPLRPWLNNAVAGGSAPLTPWYRPHAVPGAAITPNVAPPPYPLPQAEISLPRLRGRVEVGAQWFMAQVTARLTTFLR
jgi:subtilase family serine protease